MYFRLALGNVRKSFNDYLIYFLTLTFSICLFFSFNSFEDQQAVFEMTQVQNQMMESAAIIMNFLSIFVAIILAFLILYANNFLIKRRKKEFGILMILGMPKNKISRVLCYETIFIGLISMVFGLILGFLLSQGLTVLTASLFATPITRFHFIFSMRACILTVFSFTFIFFIVMIFNTFLLNKYHCIDLLYADKKNETIRVKNTFISVIIFLISLILLGYAYYRILNEGLMGVAILGPVILTGSIGTLLFFMSLSGFLLKFVQTSKNLYFKGLNMFILKQISANMNTNFISMSVVSIMLLLAIGALSTGLSINQTITTSMVQMTPYQITMDLYIPGLEDSIQTSFEFFLEKAEMDPDQYFSQIHYLEKYYDYHNNEDPLDYGVTYNTFQEGIPIEKRYNQFTYKGDSVLDIYKLSVYNDFLESKGFKKVSLNDDEVAFISSSAMGEDYIDIRSQCLDKFVFQGNEMKVKEIEYPYLSTSNSFMNSNLISIVVPDYLQFSYDSSIKTINLDLLEGVSEAEVLEKFSKAENAEIQIFAVGRQEIIEQNQGMKVVFTYVGIYLGFIFLIASCVILALQQLSQASDNRRRYAILNKIGVDQSMRNASIKRQIGIYFLMPLLIGSIHSIVGITVMNDVVQILGKADVTVPSFMTACIIIAIYGTYFYATYMGYKRILNQK